jgi:hypothetical protein
MFTASLCAVHPSINSAPKFVHEELTMDSSKAQTARDKIRKNCIKKKAAGLEM